MESTNWHFFVASKIHQKDRPVIGITMGDAAGIGPEVIVKSLCESSIQENARPVIIGDLSLLQKTAKSLAINIEFAEFSNETDQSTAIEVIDLKNLPSEIEAGTSSSVTGRASGEYIEKAVGLWKAGSISAICTAPINKESLALGGYNFPGHTEFFADLTGTADFAMSFFAERLRVILLSTHLSLTDAIKKVKKEKLEKLIRFTDRHLSELLGHRVKIAVAGLNPHASEGGMFGSEEQAEITPAIDECAKDGVEVTGPYSPDTIFVRGFNGEFDAVVALYHDQATIPVKALSFGSAVNVTLGLPVIRTSVDHGTAFDIAGKGIADASSMKAAILLAGELAQYPKTSKKLQ